ncbi:hypothetical protein AZ21_1151 [Bordetella bronchiseptica B20-10725633]|nr:hypothetical protein AZ21_1151 [Bordetella bronchiseptica B20-10725633]
MENPSFSMRNSGQTPFWKKKLLFRDFAVFMSTLFRRAPRTIIAARD